MLIIIPSYKRTEILHWVLNSVFESDLQNIDERKLIVVVNNYPPNQQIVNAIVGAFSGNERFTCCALNREVTMPAVESWFSAVAEYADEDEMVVLLGDDDLMLPWGLRDRYCEIVKHKADMLLSDFADRIYFFEHGENYWLSSTRPTEGDQDKHACRWNFWPARHPEASFISNHCYRNTAAFRRGVDLAFKWCDAQDWLAKEVRTAMLPFYLPYAITVADGYVVAMNSKCVIRGAVADEAIKTTYADGGNTTFYSLCAFDTFLRISLSTGDKKLAGVSKNFKKEIVSGFITMLFDKKISFESIKKTFIHSGLSYRDLIDVRVLKGFKVVVVKLLGLRGARLRIRRVLKLHLSSNELCK